MNLRALRFLLRKEFLQIRRDHVILGMLFGMPLVQLLLLANAATFEVKRARMYVVDQDHTATSRGLVRRLAASGRFEPADASGHPMGHILSRAVGVSGALEIDRAEGEVRPGDVFLLCSDGLHSYVGEDEIQRRLGRSPERAAVAVTAGLLAELAIWLRALSPEVYLEVARQARLGPLGDRR